MVVRDVFVSHYFLLAFLTSLGTLQISVTISGARGLWLTPHRTVTRWLGIGLIVAGVLIFYGQPLWIEGPWAEGSVEANSATLAWGQSSWSELSGARNVNDIHGGLDGRTQAIWFPLAAVLAIVTSAVVGSLSLRITKSAELDPGESDPVDDSSDGIAGLSNRSYFSNLPVSWRNFRAEIAGLWTSGLEAADRWSLFRMIFGGAGRKS